jgi:hypothetical protein
MRTMMPRESRRSTQTNTLRQSTRLRPAQTKAEFGLTELHNKGACWDFSKIRVCAPEEIGARINDGRMSLPAPDEALVDDRLLDVDIDRPLIEQFRAAQGIPPGGVDETGQPIGPSVWGILSHRGEGEIKYRPQPIAVLNGPFHGPINTPDFVGMEIAITVRYTGPQSDLAEVWDSEQVDRLSFGHTGSFSSIPPLPSDTSDFMPAAHIPNDQHALPRQFLLDVADNHGGSGSLSKHQLDIYTDPRHGVLRPMVIPNSGYLGSITAGPGTRVTLLTTKEPTACTVNGFSTAAGPSPAQSNEVVVRP